MGAGPTEETWVEAAAASGTRTGVRVRAAAETVKKLENTKVEAGAAGREANIVAREGAEEEVHGEAGGGAAVKVRGVKNKPSSLETNFLHTFK